MVSALHLLWHFWSLRNANARTALLFDSVNTIAKTFAAFEKMNLALKKGANGYANGHTNGTAEKKKI